MKKPITKLAITVQIPVLPQPAHELRPAFKPALDLKAPKRENSYSSFSEDHGIRQSKISHNAKPFPKSR
jgi:hypothetical protein